jgi:hypothetical protein
VWTVSYNAAEAIARAAEGFCQNLPQLVSGSSRA